MMKNVLCFGILLALLAGGVYGESQDTEKQYYAIYIGPAKLGYYRTTRTVKDDRVITATRMRISVQRDKLKIVAVVSTRDEETIDGKPLAFRTTQEMSGMRQQTDGAIQPDGSLKMTTESAGQKKTATVPWPKGALLSEGQRLLEMKKGLTPGTTYEIPAFDCEKCCAMPITITVGKKQKIDLLGRETELHKITQKLTTGGSPLVISMYIDDNFNASKIVTTLMGMEMTMVSCDRAFALSPCDSNIDFLKKLSLTSPVSIPADAKKVKYVIEPVGKEELNFPQIANQSVRKTRNGLYDVTVTYCEMPKGVRLPYAGNDKKILKALQPSPYVQCDAPEIKKLAEKAVDGTTDTSQAIFNIQDFVRNYIKRKDLSVGFASALEVARSKTGDCTEHAVLAAALCRAAGIPARLAFGIVYVDGWLDYKNVFVGHAWVLAYVGDKWVPLDAAVPNCQAGHIILATSDDSDGPSQFFGLMNLLGYFKFKEVDVQKK